MCVCVCIDIYIYVCMYVCMYIYMDRDISIYVYSIQIDRFLQPLRTMDKNHIVSETKLWFTRLSSAIAAII